MVAIPAYNLKRERVPGQAFYPKAGGIGYVLSCGGKRFYIAGDTEGIPEMKPLKDMDVVFLPIDQPCTVLPGEAAESVHASHPKIGREEVESKHPSEPGPTGV